MRLYGASASPFVTRVQLFAHIKGVDIDLHPIPGQTPRSPEYRAITPIGKMPALEVDGRVICESEVICEYLEDAFPSKSGFPKNSLDRASSRLVSRIIDLYIAPNNGTLFRNANPNNRNQEAVDQAAGELAKGFEYLSHFMEGTPYCAGDKPSLGDCSAAPYFVLLKKAIFPAYDQIDDPTETDERLKTWWQAISKHPDFKPLLDAYAIELDAFMKIMAAKIQGIK